MLPPSEDAHSNSNSILSDSPNHNITVSSHQRNTNHSGSCSPNLTVVVDSLTPVIQDINKSNLSVLDTNNFGNNGGTGRTDNSLVRATFVDFTLDISDSGGFVSGGPRSTRSSATASSGGGSSEPVEEEEDDDEDKDFYNSSLNPDLHKIRAEQIRNWLEYENNHSNSNSLVSAGSISAGELLDDREFEPDSLNLHDVVNLGVGRNRRVRFLTDQEGNLLISVFLTNMIDDEEQQRLKAHSQSQHTDNDINEEQVDNEPVAENGHSSENGHTTPEVSDSCPKAEKDNGADVDVNNNSDDSPEIIDDSVEEEKIIQEKSPIDNIESPQLVFIVMEDGKDEPNYTAMDKNMTENIIAVQSETEESDTNENDPDPELVELTEDTKESQEFSDSETLSASSSCDSMIEIIPGAQHSSAVPTEISLKDEMEIEFNKRISTISEDVIDEVAVKITEIAKIPEIAEEPADETPVLCSQEPHTENLDANNNLLVPPKADTVCYDEADKSMTSYEFNPENEMVIVAESESESKPESIAADVDAIIEDKPVEQSEIKVKDIETEIAELEREIEEEIKGRTENSNNTVLKFNPIINGELDKEAVEMEAVGVEEAAEEIEEEEEEEEPEEEKTILTIVNPFTCNGETNEIKTSAEEAGDMYSTIVQETTNVRWESPSTDVSTEMEEENVKLMNRTNDIENVKAEFITSSECIPESEEDISEQQLESLRVEEEPISSVALQIAKWESLAKKVPPTKSIGSSMENLTNICNGATKGKLNGALKSINKNGFTTPKPDNCPTKSTVWNCWNKSNKGADDEEIIYAQPNNNTVMMTSLSNPSAVLKSHPKPSSRGEILNWFKDGEIHRAGLIISNNTFGIHHSSISNNNSNNVDGSAAPVVVSWFFGLITRVQAEKFLHGQPTGTFLVRISTRITGYTLSLQSNQRTKHFLISAHNPSAVPPSLQTDKDKNSASLASGPKNLPKPLLSAFASQGRYAFIGTNMTPYTTLASLIRHHSHAPITKSGGEKLLFPCSGGPNLTGVEYLFK